MPVRTYTGLDLINYSETDNTGEVEALGTVSRLVVPISQAVLSLVASGNGASSTPSAFDIEAFGSVDVHGELDFDVFPSIPDNAVIMRIRAKMEATITAQSNATIPLNGGLVAVGGKVSWVTNALELTDLTIVVDDNMGPGVNLSVTQNASITFSTEQVLDFSPVGITKAQLVADYTDHDWALECEHANPTISRDSTATTGAVGDFSNTVTLNNFQFIVEYESGPEVSLTPSGGNVESGQIIQVSSPDVDPQTLTYAALQGNKVIPIPISPEGELEIPAPPTDPCLDCLTGCTECDDCFTVCEEDLEGEACQACMEACLDCLINCLEDLEDAEECQDSTQDPPAAIPIVIICSGPPFPGGSVPLGNFTILVANASGIYHLVDGKAEDTLYSSVRDGTTFDVKIPNPGAKTGFFRS